MSVPVGSTKPALRVVLVTRQLLLGYALGNALSDEADMDVTVLHTEAPDLVERCTTPDADVLLVDIEDDSLGAPWLTDVLAAELSAHLVVLAATADLDTVTEAVERGARGVVTSDTAIAKIPYAIRDVYAGRMVLPSLTSEAGPDFEAMSALDSLTDRERDILRRLAQGASTEEIARERGIAVNTARTHIQNILSKLGLHSRVQAAAYAARAGLE